MDCLLDLERLFCCKDSFAKIHWVTYFSGMLTDANSLLETKELTGFNLSALLFHFQSEVLESWQLAFNLE